MRRLVPLALVAAAVALAVWRPWTRHAASGLSSAGRVLLVGDSLNVGVEPYLRDRLRGWSIETDDVVGRETATGVEHLRALGVHVPPYVVVSLGTNDSSNAVAAFRGYVEEVLRLAGSRRCVVWATIRRDGDAYEPFNSLLDDEARRNRNLQLVDWAAMVARDPSLIAFDGIHGSPDGYRARADAIVGAMGACRRTGA